VTLQFGWVANHPAKRTLLEISAGGMCLAAIGFGSKIL